MDEPNPYAPPAVTMDTRQSDAPLPDGVRRFRLDPARYDRFQRMIIVRLFAIVLPVFVLLFAVLALVTPMQLSSAVALALVTVGWVAVARYVRLRFARKKVVDSYELLVSDRAARRNLGGWVSAEVLRPEVTKIYDVATGFWITGESPPQSLFVANAIEKYDDARALFSGWGTFERLTGFAAWRRARKEARRQGRRDMTFGTALATDASLAAELALLQNVSMTAGADRPASRYAPLVRAVVIWFALIFMFLAIWQFLAPSGPR